MALKAAVFAGEYEALGAWTGQTRAELIEEEGREFWLCWDGDRVVGVLRPWLRPDGRLELDFGRCEPRALPVLLARVHGECFTTVDGADSGRLAELGRLGFRVERREFRYSVPVAPVDAPVPVGLEVISAAATRLEPLLALDCALREDVPGSQGWQPDPVWFREETYDSPFFDPEAYLVALDGADYVGLVRVWNGPRPLPRLGLIAVLPPYRRRGLARGLIGQAFAALHARGVREVTAEVDDTNTASNALLTGFGGVVTGSDLELRRAG